MKKIKENKIHENKIKEKIKRVEELLENCGIGLITYDFYDKLLEIHRKLGDYLYFKKFQEKDFFKPIKNGKEKKKKMS